MVPKWVAIAWSGCPLAGFWLAILVLSPLVGNHETDRFRAGELYVLSMLSLFWVLTCLFFWAWNDKPEDS